MIIDQHFTFAQRGECAKDNAGQPFLAVIIAVWGQEFNYEAGAGLRAKAGVFFDRQIPEPIGK